MPECAKFLLKLDKYLCRSQARIARVVTDQQNAHVAGCAVQKSLPVDRGAGQATSPRPSRRRRGPWRSTVQGRTASARARRPSPDARGGSAGARWPLTPGRSHSRIAADIEGHGGNAERRGFESHEAERLGPGARQRQHRRLPQRGPPVVARQPARCGPRHAAPRRSLLPCRALGAIADHQQPDAAPELLRRPARSRPPGDRPPSTPSSVRRTRHVTASSRSGLPSDLGSSVRRTPAEPACPAVPYASETTG